MAHANKRRPERHNHARFNQDAIPKLQHLVRDVQQSLIMGDYQDGGSVFALGECPQQG